MRRFLTGPTQTSKQESSEQNFASFLAFHHNYFLKQVIDIWPLRRPPSCAGCDSLDLWIKSNSLKTSGLQCDKSLWSNDDFFHCPEHALTF